MINVKIDVTVSAKLQKALDKATSDVIDDATAREIGDVVTEEMRSVIESGTSPIEGKGKFPRYKDPKRYPGKLKKPTPVNLKLTGEFLDALTADVVQGDYGKAVEIYYADDQEVKEQGHREGSNGQPSRPTLPALKGEQFSARIRKLYTDILRKRVLDVLKGEG